jgi:hypothetical protein
MTAKLQFQCSFCGQDLNEQYLAGAGCRDKLAQATDCHHRPGDSAHVHICWQCVRSLILLATRITELHNGAMLDHEGQDDDG